MDERRLEGGRTQGAVRIGDTVRRPVRPWTPAVHALLDHLAALGVAGAPRVLGIDEQGRETLSFLPGETVGERLPWPPWAFADGTLAEAGRWLRRLHDATAGYRPPEGATWFAGQNWRPGLIIGHHDAAPYNAVWRDGNLAGFVDWDTAGPSTRELDLAFTALTWVPLHNRAFAELTGFTAFDERAGRLRILLDSYGHEGDRAAFGAAVAARARVNAAGIHRLAGGGDPAYAHLLPVAEGYERSAAEIEALPAAFWTA
ncbi:MAG TPA: phosphotransferase [Phytomonospora sp.]